MRVVMPLRGRATARNCSALPGRLRFRLGSRSLEGPWLSSDRLSLEADFFSFAAFLIRATSARGLVSCLDFSVRVQVMCACTTHVWRVYRHEMAIAERLCTVLCDLETSRCPRTVLFKGQAERGSFARESQVRVRGSTRGTLGDRRHMSGSQSECPIQGARIEEKSLCAHVRSRTR